MIVEFNIDLVVDAEAVFFRLGRQRDVVHHLDLIPRRQAVPLQSLLDPAGDVGPDFSLLDITELIDIAFCSLGCILMGADGRAAGKGEKQEREHQV